MKRGVSATNWRLLLAGICFLGMALSAQQIGAQTQEEAAARVPVENYMRAFSTGERDFILRAFHPDARVTWYRNGELRILTVQQFAAGFTGQPSTDVKPHIEALQITGNVGTAKVVLDYPKVKYTDYLSLLKIGEEWKIVNKIFYSQNQLPPPTSGQSAFLKLIQDEGVQRARQIFEAERRVNAQAVLFNEAELNSLGYQFLYQQKRTKEAIEVFRLNVDAYPSSVNVYDSLAEAYLINGEIDLAVQNYRKSLELNPKNRNAVDMLARIWVRLPNDGWKDKSPHKSDFVEVTGVKLHYLDWGGKGEALLFLAGMGNSAHIFDDIAPRFTDSFRVLALTRRGHGQSDTPETGYDIGTLVEDIRQFLDAMKIKRASLVGHSLAGDELTRFASLYPSRVAKLVYLDAANDRSELTDADIYAKIPSVFAKLSPSENDVSSYKAYRDWTRRNVFGFWSEAQEADRRATIFGSNGRLRPALPENVATALNQSTREAHPEYTQVKARALSFHAIFSLSIVFPWLAPSDTEERRKAQEFLDEILIPHQRKQMERFRKEVFYGQVIEMLATHHYLFITRRDEVVRAVRQFLLDKGR